MMEEELEKAHPSYSEGPTNEVDPISERDQELLNQFAEELEEELQGKDSRKMMFILDVAVHVGESPSQLRQIVDEKEVEAIYQARMAIWTKRNVGGSVSRGI